MSLTADDMQRLEQHAREIASETSRGYIADALRCLADTRDPIAALALLRALWSSAHARRDQQRACLEDVGHWLDLRIRRDPGISAERLALELGWLHRLVRVHSSPDDSRDDGDRSPSRHADTGPPPFGAYIDMLRSKRDAALAVAAAAPTTAPRARPAAGPALPELPAQLPATFEVRFADWQAALEVFKNARKRRKQGKSLKDHLLAVAPVATELAPLAADLACSLVHTDGVTQLLDDPGELPTFWIATADLAPRDGKRVAARIALAPAGS